MSGTGRRPARRAAGRTAATSARPSSPTATARSTSAAWRSRAEGSTSQLAILTTSTMAAFEELLIEDLRVLGPNHLDPPDHPGHLDRWRGRLVTTQALPPPFEELLA